MATLVSPGVQVSIINESFYGDAGPGTIPLIVLATAANKAAPSGSGVAPFTVPAMANKLFLATSQLELTSNFGVPFFKSYQGTMLHGNETNEWGLLAAYNYLGISNRAYILRADIDTAQLEPSGVAPVGPPVPGQYWLNLSKTAWGVFQSNGAASAGLAWTQQTILIPSLSQVNDDNTPADNFGASGDFCIVPWANSNFLFQKGNPNGGSQVQWGLVGSADWKSMFPVRANSVPNPHPVADGSILLIEGHQVTITASDPSGTTTLDDVVMAINAAAIPHITASTTGNGALVITNTAGNDMTLADHSGSHALTTLGITPATYHGVSFTMTSTPQYPSGSVQGSVWIKGNPSRNGAVWSVNYYSGATATWTTLSAPFYPFNSGVDDGTIGKDNAAMTALGHPIAGSVYIGYDPNSGVQQPRRWNGTAWAALSYEADKHPPSTPPVAGTLWFDQNSSFAADVMVGTGNQWVSYLRAYPQTDRGGILIDASAPTTQSTGDALVANDLWLDSSDSEHYPLLHRWDSTAQRWRLIDQTDQTSPFGIIFADARQDSGVNFTGNPSDGNYNYNSTAVADLLRSDYLDPDAPNPELYPTGMLLFNTRASTNTMKIWRPSYLQPGSNPGHFHANDDYTANAYTVGDITYMFPPVASAGRWVNAVGNDAANHMAPFLGRKAQRQMIVTALREIVTSNQDIRSELVHFNLIACPGYCELIDDMTNLNAHQNFVSFIVGDVPMRLPPDGTGLLNWANNARNVAHTCENGLAPGSYSADQGNYIGLCYPWGLGTDLTGNEVMIPASAIELVTIAYNDQVAYPWFAPAGFTRGLVTNASSVGYLDPTGSYQPVILNQGQRDVLYGVRPSGCQINPIAYIPGRGLVVYGQKTLAGTSSALDRINVSRLICFLRYQLAIMVKPFLFEQNDHQTQVAARNIVATFLNSLVGLRALSDYAVKCDSDNNTPARVDMNELWIDVAVRPLKAIEFVYIPVRILNSSTQPISL